MLACVSSYRFPFPFDQPRPRKTMDSQLGAQLLVVFTLLLVVHSLQALPLNDYRDLMRANGQVLLQDPDDALELNQNTFGSERPKRGEGDDDDGKPSSSESNNVRKPLIFKREANQLRKPLMFKRGTDLREIDTEEAFSPEQYFYQNRPRF